MGWFLGLINREEQACTSPIYDYRVVFESGQSNVSMNLP